jgi:hypothetical protein
MHIFPFTMLHYSLLDLFNWAIQLLVFLLVIFSNIAGSVFIPCFLLFSKLIDLLQLALLPIFVEFLVLKLLFDLIDEGFKFILRFSKQSLYSFFRFISGEDFLRLFKRFSGILTENMEL